MIAKAILAAFFVNLTYALTSDDWVLQKAQDSDDPFFYGIQQIGLGKAALDSAAEKGIVLQATGLMA